MKVKIGDKVYDSNDELIIVYLSDNDKENISTMSGDANLYASYPDDGSYDTEETRATMLDFKIQVEARFWTS